MRNERIVCSRGQRFLLLRGKDGNGMNCKQCPFRAALAVIFDVHVWGEDCPAVEDDFCKEWNAETQEERVEVVHCRDCIYGGEPTPDYEGWIQCTNLPGGPMFKEYGFCSDGERKK